MESHRFLQCPHPSIIPLSLAFFPVRPTFLQSSMRFSSSPLNSALSAGTSRQFRTFTARARRQRKEDVASTEKEDKPVPLEEEYEEVEIPWYQEKAEDFVQMTGTAVNSVPGPRVGDTGLPWLLAVPIGYLSITFLIAIVRTVLKYSSPKAQRRRLVGKNAFLCKSIDDYFPFRRLELDREELKKLESKTNFDTQEVLRKYIRYALNERPFNPDLVADLIHLKKVSQLEDLEVVEILNDVSRRIVKEKGPVLMDTRGLTEKGVKRKASVQALFSKLLYLSELDEFCSTTSRSSLGLKEIFGVTDEDANSIRIDTLSEVTDVESLEKMVSPSDLEKEED